MFDPFCGSGTVLLEAALRLRHAAGADSNPLARLITNAKLTPIDPKKLERARSSVFSRVTPAPRGNYPDVVNLDYWFYPHVKRDLLRLLEAISPTKDIAIRNFLLATLSSCIRGLSRADPRLSVPVRLREDQYESGHWLHERTVNRLKSLKCVDVLGVFAKRLQENINRMLGLTSLPMLGRLISVEDDARNLVNIKSKSVSLAITSPPYLSAQKYIRASSLNLTWLGLCTSAELRLLEDRNIGREHFLRRDYLKETVTGIAEADHLVSGIRDRNQIRAHMACAYLLEMQSALVETARTIRAGGHLVLVVGSSTICGEDFPTPKYLTKICESLGFEVRMHLLDTIRSRALMTKRHKSAGRIDQEAVIVLRKAA